MWNACRATTLQGAEPVSQTYELPQTQFEQVADLYEMQFDDGRTCAFHTDGAKAAQWLLACDGNKVQEYVRIERYQEAVIGNSPVIPEDLHRAAMLQDNQRDLSQPVDPQVAEYEQIMLQAGWVMVPVEPTDEMIAAAMECDDVVFDSKDPTAFCVQFREIYCAMVTAAPKPEGNSK
ncbi:TPA: hypothetical protein JES98_001098 [Salmonella enterica subsp. enterica serovar Wangata]|nr:hypothetical protein [Salmonella enterica subsp. enterica serovar Wangata]